MTVSYTHQHHNIYIYIHMLCLVYTGFTVRFMEIEYRYEEGEPDAQVCLEGEGEIAQTASAIISSPSQGSATGKPTTFV